MAAIPPNSSAKITERHVDGGVVTFTADITIDGVLLGTVTVPGGSAADVKKSLKIEARRLLEVTVGSIISLWDAP